MARRISRRKKSSWLVALLGVAAGLAAWLAWKKYRTVSQTPLITAGRPTITPKRAPIAVTG